MYFHEHAVADGRFDDLEVGAAVRFVLAEGEGRDGPQASTVVPERHPERAVTLKEARVR